MHNTLARFFQDLLKNHVLDLSVTEELWHEETMFRTQNRKTSQPYCQNLHCQHIEFYVCKMNTLRVFLQYENIYWQTTPHTLPLSNKVKKIQNRSGPIARLLSQRLQQMDIPLNDAIKESHGCVEHDTSAVTWLDGITWKIITPQPGALFSHMHHLRKGLFPLEVLDLMAPLLKNGEEWHFPRENDAVTAHQKMQHMMDKARAEQRIQCLSPEIMNPLIATRGIKIRREGNIVWIGRQHDRSIVFLGMNHYPEKGIKNVE